jgi:hypothetical protein
MPKEKPRNLSQRRGPTEPTTAGSDAKVRATKDKSVTGERFSGVDPLR